jgi:hypothetical protein
MEDSQLNDPELRRIFLLRCHRRMTRDIWKAYLTRKMLLKCSFESDNPDQEKSYCAQLIQKETVLRSSLSVSASEIMYNEIYDIYTDPYLLPYYWRNVLKPASDIEARPRTLIDRVISSFASQVSRVIAFPCHKDDALPLHDCWIPPASNPDEKEKK